LLGAIRRLAAFTTTHLVLGDGEGLCLCASTTADFFCFPITASHLQDTFLGACTLAESTPGTFAIFWAARQVTGSGVDVAMLVVAVASTWGRGNVDLENSILFAARSTFCTTRTIPTVGALTPVFPVALTIDLTGFSAACMGFLSTACLWANKAAMTGCSGDGIHPFLNSTTTGCGTRTVLAPTSFAVNCAWFDVASLLLFISITMKTVHAALHTIEEFVLASLQATSTGGGALAPWTPRSTGMVLFLGCERSALTRLPCCPGGFSAVRLACLLIRSPQFLAFVFLDASLLPRQLALLRSSQGCKGSACFLLP
jgi:hypothetical protein